MDIKGWIGAALFFSVASGIPSRRIAQAQITPDSTLPINSQVSTRGNQTVIEGGTKAGSNLFHSFREFSVPTGTAAYFNNAASIVNIFSRVTGGSVSTINGLIRANGAANLFLLNPNGILFGPNAVLNIGGSFLGSTANLIEFTDGVRFSATDPSAPPLLTVSAPLGLVFENNAGSISIQGSGHNLTGNDPTFSPFTRSGPFSGLAVRPGQTLALVGGTLSLQGGNLAAPGGRIELGGVGSGTVKLIPADTGFGLNYSEVRDFRDLSLTSQASADASGLRGGSVALQGGNITINDGSVVLVQNLGGGASAGDITITASQALQLNGTRADGKVRSFIINEAFSGQGGDVILISRNLSLENGAGIATRAYRDAQGGNLVINTSDSITVSDYNRAIPSAPSGIVAFTLGSGQGGDVTIDTHQLVVSGGGTIGTLTLQGTGNGGALWVKGKDITVTGISPANLFSSLISSTAGQGNGGQITVEADTLNILDGGEISSSTGAEGDAGNIFIQVSRLNLISDPSFNFILRPGADGTRQIITPSGTFESRIVAIAAEPTEAQQGLIGLPSQFLGDSGRIDIEADTLVIDRARISVSNTSRGTTGDINLKTNSLINRRGVISASGLGTDPFNTSEGGNIAITSKFLKFEGGILTTVTRSLNSGNITITGEDLRFSTGSEVSAKARGEGNGGNITIDTDTLLALNNSDISANAFQGQGGNIRTNAQGVFLSPDSEITASSQFGINGTVEINTPESNLQSALLPLNAEIISPDDVLEGSCLARTRSSGSFVDSGTGGLPETPESGIDDLPFLSGDGDSSSQGAQGTSSQQSVKPFATVKKDYTPWQPGMPIIAANRIVQLPDGRFVSVAVPETLQATDLICK